MQLIQGCMSVYPLCTLRSGWTFNPSAEPSAISGFRRRAPPGPWGQCPWTMQGRGQARHLSNLLKTFCGGAGKHCAWSRHIRFEALAYSNNFVARPT